jgi:hypothetical protein
MFYGFTGITIQTIDDDPESLAGVSKEELPDPVEAAEGAD